MSKSAIVTGGSRGIGEAIVRALAADGFDVAIIFQGSVDKANALKDELIAEGKKAIAVKCDVSNASEVSDMVNEVVKEFGGVDVLVNNAGRTKDGLLMRMSEEDFDSVINTNLKGAFNCTKAVTPVMMKARSGKIVNISSVVGVTGNAGQANYAASKAGIIGLTKSAAKELATRGITVNSVAPGYVKTDMTEVLSDKVKEAILAQIPMKKCAEPEDIANVVSFLCSDKASYVTGQVINVDGGMVM